MEGTGLPDQPWPHPFPVVALQCYTCPEPISVSSCDTITTCNANETMCKTTLYSLETGQWGRSGRAVRISPRPSASLVPPRTQ